MFRYDAAISKAGVGHRNLRPGLQPTLTPGVNGAPTCKWSATECAASNPRDFAAAGESASWTSRR